MLWWAGLIESPRDIIEPFYTLDVFIDAYGLAPLPTPNGLNAYYFSIFPTFITGVD